MRCWNCQIGQQGCLNAWKWLRRSCAVSCLSLFTTWMAPCCGLTRVRMYFHDLLRWNTYTWLPPLITSMLLSVSSIYFGFVIVPWLFSLHIYSFILSMCLHMLTTFPVLPGWNHWNAWSVITQSCLYVFVTCGLNVYYRMHFKHLLWVLVMVLIRKI